MPTPQKLIDCKELEYKPLSMLKSCFLSLIEGNSIHNAPLATLWLSDEQSQSAPTYKHTFLDSKQGVNKARGLVVKEKNLSNGKAFWGWANRTTSLNSYGVDYIACLSG